MTRSRKLAVSVTALIGVLLLAVAGVAIFVAVNRVAVSRDLLRIVAEKTGSRIQVSSLGLRFAPGGIEVIGEDIEISYPGESATAKRLEAVVGYGTLLKLRLLPLKSISLTSPNVQFAGGGETLTRSDYCVALSEIAHTVSRVTGRVEVRHGVLSFPSPAAPGPRAPRVEIEGRIEANTRGARVTLSRLKWHGAELDGLSASARLNVASAGAKPMTPTRGAIEFTLPRSASLQGELQVTLTSKVVLNGHVRIHASHVPRLGEAGFDGSYSFSQHKLRLLGAVSVSPDLGIDRDFPAQAVLTSPFSADPQLLVRAGPFHLDPAEAAKTLNLKETSAITGKVAIGRLEFATELGPWSAALRRCSDSECERRETFGLLLHKSRATLVLAQVDLGVAAWPRGIRRLQLERPVELAFYNGVVTADNVSARVGAVQIVRGAFRLYVRHIRDDVPTQFTYTGASPLTLDVAQLNIEELLPAHVRGVFPEAGLAYAYARVSGALALRRGGLLKPDSLRLRLRRGFLRLRDHQVHETVLFHGRAHLEHQILESSAWLSLFDGGTLALAGRFALPSRTLNARITVRKANLRRWSSAFARYQPMPRLKISGEADGHLAVSWKMAGGKPRLRGRAVATALTIDSPFTKTPALVRHTRVAFKGENASMRLDGVMLGAGDFNARVEVADVSNPSMRLMVTGDSFDLDALDLNALRATRVKSAPATSKPAISAKVLLRAVSFQGVRLEHVVGEFSTDDNGWTVRSFSARVLRGSVKFVAARNKARHSFHLVGGAHRIDARRLFAVIDGFKAGRPPVTGRLSARINAGVILTDGAKLPKPSCGGATVVISDGTLGKADLLERILEMLSLKSWLAFNPPDLDTAGLSFDKLTARLAFAPQTLLVEHVQLSGPAVRIVGRGHVDWPRNRLDLHLAVLPFTTVRWLLGGVPLVGTAVGSAFDRVFAVRIKVSGPVASPAVSPRLFKSAIDALVGVVELPIDFVPDVKLPTAASLTPASNINYSPGCSPPWTGEWPPTQSGGSFERQAK
jgi:hypothetical protein